MIKRFIVFVVGIINRRFEVGSFVKIVDVSEK